MKKNNELQICLLSNFGNLITVQLDDSNYVTWRFLLESMLVGCDLMGYIDGSFSCPSRYIISEKDGITSEITHEYSNWKKNDRAVMTLLAATLSSDALSFIVGSKTSQEIWCQLKEKYASASQSNIQHLKTSLYNIRKGSDSIDKYLLRVKVICDQLAAVGVSMADEDIQVSVLNGLPSAYVTIKTIIRTKKTLISMQELRSLLLIAEDEIEEAAKSTSLPNKTAMATYGGTSGGIVSSDPLHDSCLPNSGKVHTSNMIVRPPVGTSSNAVYNSAYPTQYKNNSAGAFQCGLNNHFVPYFWFRGFTSGQKSGQRDRFSFHSPQFGRGSTDCGPLNGFNAPHLFSGPNSFAVLNNSFGSSVSGVRNGSFGSTMAVHRPHNNSQAQGLCSQVGYIDNPHGAFFSPRTCQICYTSGHVALRCSQRSAPRQVVASGSSFQCQICLKTGHTAAECLHRHHYDFHPPTSAKPQAIAASFSSQSMPAFINALPSLCHSLPHDNGSQLLPLIPPG